MKQANIKEWQKIRCRQAAYATFEKKILDLYERKMLTLVLLDHVANQFHQVDSAGSQSLLVRDGKDLYQVCIELVDPTFPIVAKESSEDHEEYWERELKKWEEIMYIRWGWERRRASFHIQSQQDAAATLGG